jgi:hypothetical protein
VFTVTLLDPYGPELPYPRRLVIRAGDVVDAAALAECLARGHRPRYRLLGRRACADCLQDAIAAAAGLGLLGRRP